MEKVYGVDKFVEDLDVPCVGREIAWYFFDCWVLDLFISKLYSVEIFFNLSNIFILRENRKKNDLLHIFSHRFKI